MGELPSVDGKVPIRAEATGQLCREPMRELFMQHSLNVRNGAALAKTGNDRFDLRRIHTASPVTNDSHWVQPIV